MNSNVLEQQRGEPTPKTFRTATLIIDAGALSHDVPSDGLTKNGHRDEQHDKYAIFANAVFVTAGRLGAKSRDRLADLAKGKILRRKDGRVGFLRRQDQPGKQFGVPSTAEHLGDPLDQLVQLNAIEFARQDLEKLAAQTTHRSFDDRIDQPLTAPEVMQNSRMRNPDICGNLLEADPRDPRNLQTSLCRIENDTTRLFGGATYAFRFRTGHREAP